MKLPTKPCRNYTANYQVLVEPEVKMRLIELKTFHNVDVPQCIRILIKNWLDLVEKELK